MFVIRSLHLTIQPNLYYCTTMFVILRHRFSLGASHWCSKESTVRSRFSGGPGRHVAVFASIQRLGRETHETSRDCR